MFKKIILCATAQQLTAGVWRFGRLASYQAYQNNEQGHQAFAEFLKQHPATKIYLLADAVEEDYRVESLPHTSGGARQELLTRKLGQIYRGITYRAAHFVTRDKDKRKDDRFLFVSLNNAEFLQGWMTCIQTQEASLVGVYLLSMVSQVLVKRLKLAQPDILLSERLSSGLRQTYLFNNSMRISRLAPIPEAMLNRLAYFYSIETEKTRLYLISQRFINKDTPLNMVIASLDEADTHIARGIEQEHGIHSNLIDLSALAKPFGLTLKQLQQVPELLHMHLLAIGNVPDNLATGSLVRHYQIKALYDAIVLATAGVFVAGLLCVGWNLQQIYATKAALDQTRTETYIQEQKYNEAAKGFTPTLIAGADLKTAVTLNQTIAQYPKLPIRMMRVLGAALEKSPEIQLNRLNWIQTNDIAMKDEDKTSALSTPKESEPVSPGNVNDPANLYELTFVNGEIKDFAGDYRAALTLVNQLVERLRMDSNIVQVSILQAPVNVSSYTDLQGSTTDQTSALTSAANFKLRLVLNHELANHELAKP